MTTFDEALNIILNSTKIGTRRISLSPINALNRITFSDISSKIDYPAENNSAMDGYAIVSSLTKNVSQSCKIDLKLHNTTIYAGTIYKERIKKDLSVKIMTGGYMPDGFDAVIPAEQSIIANGRLIVTSPVKTGLNVRFKGEDIKKKEKIIKKNTKLSHESIALLSACNIKKVPVYDDIPVSIISTGNEIISPGQTYKHGKVINSNGILAASFLSGNGCRIIKNTICKDRTWSIRKEISASLEDSRIIITSAGASFGEKDFTEQVLLDLGLKLKIRQVGIKPGKPFSFGLINKMPVFIMPGNPVAFFICLIVFVKPFIERQLGIINNENITSKITSDFHKNHDRREFIPAKTFIKDGCLYSEPYKKIGPAMISGFGSINSIISLPENLKDIKTHDNLDVYVL